jgi:hypothetical protein
LPWKTSKHSQRLDGHAEVSPLLEHRHQLVGFPVGRLKTVDSRHAHRSSLPLSDCPCDIACPVSAWAAAHGGVLTAAAAERFVRSQRTEERAHEERAPSKNAPKRNDGPSKIG